MNNQHFDIDKTKLPIIIDEWKSQAKAALTIVAGVALVLLGILVAVLRWWGR